ATYSEARTTFSSLLHWHLVNGTRRPGDPKRHKAWGNKEFGGALKQTFDEKSVRNWRKGITIPRILDHIERTLFGEEMSGQYVSWRDDLRAAYAAAVHEGNESRNIKAEPKSVCVVGTLTAPIVGIAELAAYKFADLLSQECVLLVGSQKAHGADSEAYKIFCEGLPHVERIGH